MSSSPATLTVETGAPSATRSAHQTDLQGLNVVDKRVGKHDEDWSRAVEICRKDLSVQNVDQPALVGHFPSKAGLDSLTQILTLSKAIRRRKLAGKSEARGNLLTLCSFFSVLPC